MVNDNSKINVSKIDKVKIEDAIRKTLEENGLLPEAPIKGVLKVSEPFDLSAAREILNKPNPHLSCNLLFQFAVNKTSLSELEINKVETHISSCDQCRSEIEEMKLL